MNINYRKSLQYIALLVVLFIALIAIFYLLIARGNTIKPVDNPADAVMLSQLYDFIDDTTRDTLNANLEAYTEQDLAAFVVVENSYNKQGDATNFQLLSTANLAIYDITITPSQDGDYTYVYVSCAPDDQQNIRGGCKIHTGHADE